MPYDATLKAFYGRESILIESETRDRLIGYLSGKLNDVHGTYYPLLNLAAGVTVLVTRDTVEASDAYTSGQPSVLVLQGPKPERTQSGKNIAGVHYPGKRVSITFELDMAMGTLAATETGPAQQSGDDDLLCNVVEAVIDAGYSDLEGLGLFHCIVSRGDSEGQRNANRRNPRTVTFFTVTLDNYAP